MVYTHHNAGAKSLTMTSRNFIEISAC